METDIFQSQPDIEFFHEQNDLKLKFAFIETKTHLLQHAFHIFNRHGFLTTIKFLSENIVLLKSKI